MVRSCTLLLLLLVVVAAVQSRKMQLTEAAAARSCKPLTAAAWLSLWLGSHD